jgi:putative PIN family toxin of toxin-antitoxin system
VRVFLDTDVLAAASATRGVCADLVRYLLTVHEVTTGDVVLDELRKVLDRRFALPAATIKEILDLLGGLEVVPKPERPASVPIRDPDDAWVLASAMAGRADVLVTGDRDLLDIAESVPFPVLSPRGFWELVRKDI